MKSNCAKFLLLLFVETISFFSSYGQQNDTLEIQRDKVSNKITFARFAQTKNPQRKSSNVSLFLKSVLNTKKDDELRIIKTQTDELGFTHQKFQQYYKEIKVEGGEFMVHIAQDYVQTINGVFADLSMDVKPNLSMENAVNKVRNYIHFRNYKWNGNINENTPKGELIIAQDSLEQHWYLSWKFTVEALDTAQAENIYVDAKNGQLIKRSSLICMTNSPGSATTRYSGIQAITGDSFTGRFRLREVQNNVNIQTFNFLHGVDYNNTANAIDFVDNDNTWTAAEWNNANQDNAALDAHWGAERVYDYWYTVHNRNSIDGNGLPIRNYVHYGTAFNNAFWWPGTLSMYYGDGDNFLFRPLVALDVCAHELGHGITQFTANLSPGTQESGALNEGFSDIWGACVENRSAPNKQTWRLGEDIIATPTFNCLRDLQNPNSITAAEGQHPDTYHGDFWDNNSEPHNNSTVLSHWFYLISQGGSDTNDIGNSFTVNAIGIDHAQRIAYRAEAFYLTSSSNYSAARTGSIQAAKDLYGTGSCDEIAVTNAWYAVGVGVQYAFSINGSSQFCTGSLTYSINAPSATVRWSVSPSGIVSLSCTNCNQTRLTKVSGGTVTLTATITNACGNISSTATKSITAGLYTPYFDVTPLGGSFCPGDLYEAVGSSNNGQGVNTFNWYIDGVLDSYHGYKIRRRCTGYGVTIELTVSSSTCGTSGIYRQTYECQNGKGFSMSPNPTTNLVKIKAIGIPG